MVSIALILPKLVIFALLAGVTAVAAWRLANRLFPSESLPGAVTISLFIAIAFVHLLILSLGAVGALGLLPYSIGLALFFAAGLYLGRGRREEKIRLTWFEAVALLVVIGYFAWFAVTGMLSPPQGTDDLEYHLPYTAQALRTGSLSPFFTPYTGPIYYPMLVEAGYLWLLLPVGNDFLINLGNLPFLALLALSLRQMLREWGVSRNWAALAMPLILFSKIVSKQAWVAHVDAPLASLFAFTVYMTAKREREGGGTTCLVFAAMSAGLLLNTKYSAVGYAGLLAAAWAAAEFLRRRGAKKALASTAAFLSLLAAVGCYYYLRNLAVTGTPLYPAGVTAGGVELFREGSFFFIRDLSRTTLAYTLFHRPWSLGNLANGLVTGVMFWTAIALPVALLAPFDKKQRLRGDRPPVPVTALLSSVLVALTLVLYLMTPYTGPWSPTSKLDIIYRGVRQGISCWSMSLVVALYWFDRRAPWPDGPSLAQRPRAGFQRIFWISAAVLLIAATLVYPDRHKNYFGRLDKEFRQWTPCWWWLDRRAPEGSTVAFTQMYIPYHDFGRSFQHSVTYVSTNQVNGKNYHEFEGKGLKTIFDQPEFEHWISNLRENRVDYIHWGKRKDREEPDTVELRWMLDRPGIFEPMVDKEYCKIFKFKPD